FILMAKTSDDPRKGLTAFLFHKDDPGWEVVRRIPIMGPEEHGGHCEIRFDGLRIPDENRLMNVGDGLKVTQIRLGPACLTHCMRSLGMATLSPTIAAEYVSVRASMCRRLAGLVRVQWVLGEADMGIQVGRLLNMDGAWKLVSATYACKEG